jgi:hypothetical protein
MGTVMLSMTFLSNRSVFARHSAPLRRILFGVSTVWQAAEFLATREDVLPKSTEIWCTGVVAGHAYYSQRGFIVFSFHLGNPLLFAEFVGQLDALPTGSTDHLYVAGTTNSGPRGQRSILFHVLALSGGDKQRNPLATAIGMRDRIRGSGSIGPLFAYNAGSMPAGTNPCRRCGTVAKIA